MKRVIPVLLFIVIALSTTIKAQGIKYGFSFGLTYITAPDYFTNDIDTTGRALGLSTNFHFGGKIKFNLQPIPIRLTGSILYTSFNGSKNNVIVGPSTAIDITTSTNLFTVGFGAEYLFMPEPVSPYALLELQLNSQGSTKFNKQFPNGSQETTREGNSRWGLGFGVGLDVGIIPQIDLDGALKMNFVNLFGKTSNEDAFSTFTLTLSILYHPEATKKP